jgi:hypothetical protein
MLTRLDPIYKKNFHVFEKSHHAVSSIWSRAKNGSSRSILGFELLLPWHEDRLPRSMAGPDLDRDHPDVAMVSGTDGDDRSVHQTPPDFCGDWRRRAPRLPAIRPGISRGGRGHAIRNGAIGL